MAYWGYHAIFDCAACDRDLVSSHDNIYDFIKALVPAIDMVAFGEPQINHFATHDRNVVYYWTSCRPKRRCLYRYFLLQAS